MLFSELFDLPLRFLGLSDLPLHLLLLVLNLFLHFLILVPKRLSLSHDLVQLPLSSLVLIFELLLPIEGDPNKIVLLDLFLYPDFIEGQGLFTLLLLPQRLYFFVFYYISLHSGLLLQPKFYVCLLLLEGQVKPNAVLDHPHIWLGAGVVNLYMLLNLRKVLPAYHVFKQGQVSHGRCRRPRNASPAVHQHILFLLRQELADILCDLK